MDGISTGVAKRLKQICSNGNGFLKQSKKYSAYLLHVIISQRILLGLLKKLIFNQDQLFSKKEQKPQKSQQYLPPNTTHSVLTSTLHEKIILFSKTLLNIYHLLNVLQQKKIKIRRYLKCTTANMIYLAYWTKCGKQSVGSTEIWKPRLSNYKSHIKKEIESCSIVKHFINSCNDTVNPSKYLQVLKVYSFFSLFNIIIIHFVIFIRFFFGSIITIVFLNIHIYIYIYIYII